MSLRRAVSVALLAASLTTLSAACDRQQPATGAPPSDNAGGGPSATRSATRSVGTGGIESGLVHLSTDVGIGPELHTVLDDERDLARFPGWFTKSSPKAARDIAAKAAKTDFSRSVLVGWVRATGCSEATDATLFAEGDRLSLGVDRPEPPGQCLASFQVAAVFEVPRDRMPDMPRFDDGKEADPAGPGAAVAFVSVDVEKAGDQQAEGTDVTAEDGLDGFLADLPRDDAAAVREQLSAHAPQDGERRFAWVLSGCKPTGAALVITPDDGMSAVATGDENIRCVRPQHYAAVLAVPSGLVPD